MNAVSLSCLRLGRSAVSLPVSIATARRKSTTWSCKVYALGKYSHNVDGARARIASRRELGERVKTAGAGRNQRFCCTTSSDGGQVVVPENSESPVSPAEAGAVSAPSLVESLDIRVGRIVKVWKHPEADSLYVEEVDLGEPEGPRTICSGLVAYVAQEEMENRSVLVLSNLKPRNMRGVKSNGMLLAASDASHEKVELLIPPEESQPGDRVWFGEEGGGATQSEAATPNQVAKKKIWEAVQPLLKTDAEGVANFQGRPMRGERGLVRTKSLCNGNVS